MLPHFIWQDFLDVLDDLKRNGFEMRPEWFAAQAEFRFPFCGEVDYEGVKLELRQALEPWHVWARRARSAARCAIRTALSSACR
jgi:uncharacterized protein (DUF2126 family)